MSGINTNIERGIWSAVYTGVLLALSFGCQAACGEQSRIACDKIIIGDDLDPACLLAAETEMDDSLFQLPSAQLRKLNAEPCTPNVVSTNFLATLKDPGAPVFQTTPPAENQTQYLQRQLLKSAISPPASAINETAISNRTEMQDDDLQQIIRQIRSVKIEKEQPTQQAAASAPTETTEPNLTTEKTIEDGGQKTEDRKQTADTPQQPSVIGPPSALRSQEAEASSSGISEQTLIKVEGLLKDPQNLSKTSPMELAEILFKSGLLHEAGQCYKQALAILPADDPNLASQRAWILFQIGNCFEFEDPNTAKENYAELIRTNPDSPWAEVAKSRHDLVDWLRKEQPQKLIDELTPARREKSLK